MIDLRRTCSLVVASLPLMAGALVYILFRKSDILVFRWLNALGLGDIIITIRLAVSPVASLLPDWVIYSLPNALWIISYLLFLFLIWHKTFDRNNAFWVFSIPLVSIVSEYLQLLNVIPGSFDYHDIFAYILGSVIPLAIYRMKV